MRYRWKISPSSVLDMFIHGIESRNSTKGETGNKNKHLLKVELDRVE